MDYKRYQLKPRDLWRCLGIAIFLGMVLAYLFYDSWLGMIVVPLLFLIIKRKKAKQGLDAVQTELAREFLDALRSVSASLTAGYSMENAWREAQREVSRLYGQNSLLARELEIINHSIELNTPLEILLSNLGERSGNPDITSFAEVFAFAKRSGGNFITIIQGTTEHMRARFETEREIQVLVASRKMEQKVMNIMPLLILAYLKLTSPGFLDVLYGNFLGVSFMSGCLLLYGMALVLAEKMMDIRM